MAKYAIVVGATSRMADVFIQDQSSVSGGGLTGLVYTSAGLTWSYHRDNSNAATAVTLASATLGTFTSGGFIEINATTMPGWYQLGIPDAALASGAKYVTMHLIGATNMVALPMEIELTVTDNQTALNNLSQTDIRTAVGLASANLDTQLAEIEGETDDIAAIKAKTDPLTFTVSNQVDANTLKIGGTTQTARDLGASVLVSSGTGTGQLDVTSGVITANAAKIGGTSQTGRDVGASVLLSSGTGTGQVLLSSGLVAIATGGLKRNAAFTALPFVMLDTNGDPAAGLTVTVTRMLDDDGSFTAGGLNNVVDAGSGGYTVDGIAGDIDGIFVTFLATATGARPTLFTLITLP